MRPTVGSLFSGIGGLDLGLERAGWQVRWQAENDPYCSRVLKKHWPDVPNLGDVTAIDWTDVERVDLICGGYPCQPFSLAGARRGTEDERHLWPFMRDAIGVLRPRLALLENVPGHLSMGFGAVLGDLADLGYDAEWDCIPAAAVGAPHLRYRVFVVAYARSEQHEGRRSTDQRTVAAVVPANTVSNELRLESVAERRRSGAAKSRDDGTPRIVADTDGRRFQEFAQLDGEPSADTTNRNPCWRHSDGLRDQLADPDSAPRNATRSTGEAVFGPEAVERLGRCRSRVGEHWATEPDVGRVAHGVPSRVDRLRALGNAVVPQVAEFIGTQLLSAIEAAA